MPQDEKDHDDSGNTISTTPSVPSSYLWEELMGKDLMMKVSFSFCDDDRVSFRIIL